MSAWYLQHIDANLTWLGAALALAGLVTLHFAWRRPQRHIGLVALGWGLIVLSYRYWARAAGFDSGPALGTVVLMLGAIILVMSTGQWRAKQSARTRQKSRIEKSVLEGAAPESGRRTSRTALRIIAAGPLALGAALAVSMVIVARSQWVEADRLVTAACTMLLLWAAGMAWSCAARKPAAPITAMVAVSVVSALFLPAFD